jgi:hypothetical protein
MKARCLERHFSWQGFLSGILAWQGFLAGISIVTAGRGMLPRPKRFVLVKYSHLA